MPVLVALLTAVPLLLVHIAAQHTRVRHADVQIVLLERAAAHRPRSSLLLGADKAELGPTLAVHGRAAGMLEDQHLACRTRPCVTCNQCCRGRVCAGIQLQQSRLVVCMQHGLISLGHVRRNARHVVQEQSVGTALMRARDHVLGVGDLGNDPAAQTVGTEAMVARMLSVGLADNLNTALDNSWRFFADDAIRLARRGLVRHLQWVAECELAGYHSLWDERRYMRRIVRRLV